MRFIPRFLPAMFLASVLLTAVAATAQDGPSDIVRAFFKNPPSYATPRQSVRIICDPAANNGEGSCLRYEVRNRDNGNSPPDLKVTGQGRMLYCTKPAPGTGGQNCLHVRTTANSWTYLVTLVHLESAEGGMLISDTRNCRGRRNNVTINCYPRLRLSGSQIRVTSDGEVYSTRNKPVARIQAALK